MDTDKVLKDLATFLAQSDVAMEFYTRCALATYDTTKPHDVARDAYIAIHTMFTKAHA